MTHASSLDPWSVVPLNSGLHYGIHPWNGATSLIRLVPRSDGTWNNAGHWTISSRLGVCLCTTGFGWTFLYWTPFRWRCWHSLPSLSKEYQLAVLKSYSTSESDIVLCMNAWCVPVSVCVCVNVQCKAGWQVLLSDQIQLWPFLQFHWSIGE